MNRRHRRGLVILAFALGAQSSGCDVVRRFHGKPIVARRVSNDLVATGAPSTLSEPERVIAPGIVEPRGGEIAVSARESGWIARMRVTEGQRVEAQQPLVALDDEAQRAAVAMAEADLAEAEAAASRVMHGNTAEELQQGRAEAEASQARAELAQRDAERAVLLGAKGATSSAEVERARVEARAQTALARKASARVAELERGPRGEDRGAARYRLAAIRARLELARGNLERRHVLAPAAGKVLLSRFHVGEFFGVGGAPLLVIGDTSQLQVRLEVDEIDALRVRPGQPCPIYGDSERKIADGTVARVAPRMGRRGLALESPTARADVRVREVFVDVAASDALLPGRRVWGHVEWDARAGHGAP
jgi:multidrug resistance efflux pump